MLNPGIYLGRMTECGQSESKEKKTPYFWIEFKIEYVAVNRTWEPIDPTSRDINFYLSEGAWDISIANLKSLGWNGNLESPQFSPEVSTGINLECTHEDYKGKMQERWSLPYAGRDRAPLDRAAQRALQAKLAKEFKDRPAGAPMAPPPAAVPAVLSTTHNAPKPITTPVEGVDEDSIPF